MAEIFNIDNIIVGLFKNMLRKNIDCHHDNEIISFTIRKSMLVELRDSILKSK